MKSKKMMKVLGLLVMGVGCWLAVASCAGYGNGEQQQTAADSLCYQLSEPNMDCTLYAEQPEEGLRKSVGEWMDDQLGGTFQGDAADIQKLVDFYGKKISESLHNELSELPEGTIVSYEMRMEKAFESDKVVTYSMSKCINLGGAHPSSAELAATFRKSDGRRLTWDIISQGKGDEFNKVLKECLYSYFNVQDDEGLQEMLTGIDNTNSIPLPQTPPYFMENGIAFIYQQYEIAAYAMGMPCDTIPYDRMKPFMTEWSQQLVK